MEQNPNSKPSFFKILIGDEYTNRLLLPPYFVRKHGNILPENAKLKTNSGAAWDVEIEKTSDGKQWFTNGWSEFVKDANLEFGEFAVFLFDCDEFTFHVSAFGITGYGKEIIHGPVTNRAAMTEFDNSCPHFELLFKEYLKCRVPLRKEFCEKADLIGKTAVILEYVPTRRFSIVSLADRSKRYKAFRVEMGIGWSDFRKTNSMQYMRTYLFAFNRARNVIQVQPVDDDVPENVLEDSNDDSEEEEHHNTDDNDDDSDDDDNDDDSDDDDDDDIDGWNDAHQVEIHGRTEDGQKVKSVAGSPHYEFVFKKWQIPRLPLPKEFAKKAHLLNKASVIMEYAPTRQSSMVFLDNRSDQCSYRLELAKGWNEFYKENGLKFGDTYLLTFNPAKKAIKVQPVNKRL